MPTLARRVTERSMSYILLCQSAITGVLLGAIYGLLALGLSLSWGLLRLINLSHFAMAFLAAYVTYQLGTTFNFPPGLSLLIVLPAFFLAGMSLHLVLATFRVTELSSMVVTFGMTVLIESLIQSILVGRLSEV
jgi:branched-chain amino acid transport system permease protein